MASRFQTRIVKSRARFVYAPYSPQQMQSVGEALDRSVKSRWDRAENIYDQPAKPLGNGRKNNGYRTQKERKGGRPVRDLLRTGRMRRSTRVLTAGPNQVTYGFTDEAMRRRMDFNQRRDPMWGMSPRNTEDALNAFAVLDSPVRATQVA